MMMLLYGEETLLLRRRLLHLIHGFQEKYDALGLSIQRLDGRKMRFAQFHQASGSGGLFTKKRLIVVEEFCATGNPTEQKKILETLRANTVAEDQVVIFVEPSIPRKNALFQFLQQGKHVEYFERMGPVKLQQWIREEFQQYEKRMDPQVVPLLAQRVGSDLWRLSQEIHKLVTFRAKGAVTVEDVQELVKPAYDDNVFHLTDAIAAKQTGSALKLIEQQLQHGVTPQSILSRLHWQIRMLRDASHVEPLTEQGIRDTLKLHPFVAKKTMAAVQRFQREDFDRMIEQLLSTDVTLKSTPLDSTAALDLCVVNLCNALD